MTIPKEEREEARDKGGLEWGPRMPLGAHESHGDRPE